MGRAIAVIAVVMLVIFISVFFYFQAKVHKEKREKEVELGASELKEKEAKQVKKPWYETGEFMLYVEGPSDGLDIYLNGVYTGKRTPDKFEVKPDDFVTVKGKPASPRGIVGAWVIEGKEDFLKFSSTEFDKGWRVYADTGKKLLLDGIVLKNTASQADFDALSSLANLKFITAEQCPNVISVSALKDRANILALSIEGSAVRDFSALPMISNIRALLVANSTFKEVEFLKDLTSLIELDVSGTSVSDVTSLSSLKALRSLSITGTSVEDITPLFSLEGLQTLNICATPAEARFKNQVRAHLKTTYSCFCCGD